MQNGLTHSSFVNRHFLTAQNTFYRFSNTVYLRLLLRALTKYLRKLHNIIPQGKIDIEVNMNSVLRCLTLLFSFSSTCLYVCFTKQLLCFKVGKTSTKNMAMKHGQSILCNTVSLFKMATNCKFKCHNSNESKISQGDFSNHVCVNKYTTFLWYI